MSSIESRNQERARLHMLSIQSRRVECVSTYLSDHGFDSLRQPDWRKDLEQIIGGLYAAIRLMTEAGDVCAGNIKLCTDEALTELRNSINQQAKQ